MRLKSFHAETMAEAMRQVREVLGEDAIIVATREEEGGGVRVTAAIEEQDAPPAPPSPGRRPPPDSADEVDVSEAVSAALQRHGAPAAVADAILDAVDGLGLDDPALALGAALDSVFTFQPLSEGRAPRPLMLVGPPGAGKTSLVAKIAARAVLRGRTVGVVSTDTVRAGGIEQLSAFTRALKLKLVTVEDAAALADALDVQGSAEQVLIDTTGRNPFDPEDMAALERLARAADLEPVLVLPAGVDALEAAEMAAAFREIGARRLLLTRLDIARRLGSVLAAAHHGRLSFGDVSLSPKVAEGLTPLNPLSLARLILPPAERPARTALHTGTHS